MLTYQNAKTLLGTSQEKKLQNNTYLKRVGPRKFGVFLHGTCVVTVSHTHTYTVNSGGYRTSTTKQRINEYSPARVFQKEGKWFSQIAEWDGCGVPVPFKDGMKIHS